MLREPTKEANLLKNALEDYGIEVHLEYNDGHKSVDLAIPDAKLYIEVDGIQHLIDPKQVRADLNRDYYSNQEGMGTIHIHNWEITHHLRSIARAIAETAIARETSLRRIARRGVEI